MAEQLVDTFEKKSINTINSTDVTNQNKQIIVFKLGSEEYGLYIDQIKEVVLTPYITKLPEVADFVKGVANIRGNVISILDLEERFRINKNSENYGKYTLVVASEEFKIGILVKEVPNTLSVSESSIEKSENFKATSTMGEDYIMGVVRMNGRLIILIDIYKVIINMERKSLGI